MREKTQRAPTTNVQTNRSAREAQSKNDTRQPLSCTKRSSQNTKALTQRRGTHSKKPSPQPQCLPNLAEDKAPLWNKQRGNRHIALNKKDGNAIVCKQARQEVHEPKGRRNPKLPRHIPKSKALPFKPKQKWGVDLPHQLNGFSVGVVLAPSLWPIHCWRSFANVTAPWSNGT